MRARVAFALFALYAFRLFAVPMASQQWASNRIVEAVSGIYSNVYTKAQTVEKVIEYTDRQISTGNVAFVEAVTNCPVAIGSAEHVIPESGGDGASEDWGRYGTLGALLAAFAAAITWLRNKAATTDTAIADVRADLPYSIETPVPENGVVTVVDRAVNVVSPTVTATTEWKWADGETGTPVFSNGYWTVQNASFAYDGPVAGSATDTEITFAKTDTKSFYFSYTDYAYDTGEQVFVFNVGGEGGEEVRAKCKWSEEYYENIVESVEYDGVKYVFEYPVMESSTGSTYSGIGTIAEHVVSLVTTYGPTVTLTMPQAVSGRVRDLIARIDLSQAAGAPPVAFSGGSFEAVDGEMPELVKGVNLLSFTETAAGIFAVAYKEVKPIAQGGS